VSLQSELVCIVKLLMLQLTHTRYRYNNSVGPSVRPSVGSSVRYIPVCYENGLPIVILSSPGDRPIILVL